MNASSEVELAIGLSESDRTRPIASGAVTIAGVRPVVSIMEVQALFNRQLTEHIFDCCEFPLGTYLRTLEQPDRPYVAIPVFPSRHFRLSCVFVNTTKGIMTPADLAGKRIGVPVFDMAAAVWLRGIFHDDYGLDRASPIYVAGGLNEARNGDEHPQFYPDRFTHEVRSDRSLSALLADGEIDALYTARAPDSWGRSLTVDRLYRDPIAEELAYFKRSGIFPAMHVVAIKRAVAEAHPFLPVAIMDAFVQAQRIARERLFESAALSTMLPWQLEALLFAERHLGADPWPAGLEANRTMLATAIRYMHEDGLIRRRMEPEELFV